MSERPRRFARRDDRDRQLWAVARLALASDLPSPHPWDWERLFTIAQEERCAALVWFRSGRIVRDAAPPDLTRRWRALAFLASECARRRAAQISELTETLKQVGVTPIVLKGIPLSQALYGTAAARLVADTDVFIPSRHRAETHAALLKAGWAHLYGTFDTEGTYKRAAPDGPHWLEVHSSLLDDNIIAHLAIPSPEADLIDVEGHLMAAQHGASVPLFLAVHLAKHAHVPLLWWIDFATAWERASDGDRGAIEKLAQETRLDGFLHWALEATRELAAVRMGDASGGALAIARLRGRHAMAPVVRLALVASGARDRGRVVFAWALPRSQRRRPLLLARRTLSRGWKWARRRPLEAASDG